MHMLGAASGTTILSIEDAAGYANVTATDILRWIACGALAIQQDGTHRGVLAADLERISTGMLGLPEHRQSVPKLSSVEKLHWARSLAAASDLRERWLERRNGAPFRSAGELLAESRDERSNELP